MMKNLLNIAFRNNSKRIMIWCFALLFVFGMGINEASAYLADDLVGNECPDAFNVNPVKPKGTSPNAPEQVKQAYQKMLEIREQALKMCKDACVQVNPLIYCDDDDVIDTLKANGTYNTYLALKEGFTKRTNFIKDNNAEKSCGYNYPWGCPEGKKCYKVNTNISNIRGGMAASATNINTDGWDCIDENEADVGNRKQNHFNTDSTVVREAAEDEDKTTTTTVSSTFSTALGTRSQLDDNGNFSLETTYAGGTLIDWGTFDVNGEQIDNELTNKECDIEEQKKAYLGTCYSCTIVANLIRVFMNAAAKTAPLTQEAGVRILIIGMILWFAFFVLQKISSFVSIEPMKMLQELFTFLFKCALVYAVITSGLLNIINIMVNPILSAGADYGITMIDTVSDVKLDYTSVDQKQYKIGSGELINQRVFDKIMGISKKADAAMSINFVIGNAIMCHSRHAGAIVIAKKVTDTINIPPFHFPDFWIWICGALIWFFAFMVVMGINFYLLDLSFKIGFALLALPITLGLYPFNKFKGKFVECLKIIVNAAGTFMFLGITAAMSIVLISSALGGTEQLFDAIKADNKAYISQKFAITGSSFLLILFAFLYAHKLISKTVSELVDKFFGSVTSGMNVMNEKTTQMIDFAKKTATTAVTAVAAPIGGAAVGAVKNAAGTVAKKAARTVVRGAARLGRFAGRQGKNGSSES